MRPGKRPSFAERFPREGYGWLAVVVFLLASLPLTFYGRNERSGMIHLTRPTHAFISDNLSIGYTDFLGEQPFFRENDSFVRQLQLFNGLDASADFYFKRPLYSFMAAHLSPFMGIVPALLFVNYLGWALAAWVAWKFSLELFGDRPAALIAVGLVSGGMGMVAHVGDYSAHLWSYTVYYLGGLLLLRSGVWRAPRPLRTHVSLGLYLAIAFLTYNSGLMLVGVYVVASLWWNRLWHVGLGVGLALSGQPLWQGILAYSGLTFVDLEVTYLEQALDRWGSLFALPLHQALMKTGMLLAEFITFSSPGAVLLGTVGLLLLPRDGGLRALCLALITIPVASALVFAPSAGARGYLVYGISLLFYCAAGRVLALGLRRGSLSRLAALLGLIALFSTHLLWSTSHLRGDTVPLQSYALGLDNGWPRLGHESLVALSMTGAEPTPVLFGGSGTLEEAGLYVAPATASVTRGEISLMRSMGMRLLFYLYLASLLILLAGSRSQRLAIAVVALFASLALPVVSTALTDHRLRILPSFEPFSIPAGSILRYRVNLSPQFLEAMTSKREDGDFLAFKFLRLEGPVRFRVLAGSTPIPGTFSRFQVGKVLHITRERGILFAASTRQAMKALSAAGEVTFEFTTDGPAPLSLAAWQRPGLEGRGLSLKSPAGEEEGLEARRLPAVEIRLQRPDRSIKLVGF